MTEVKLEKWESGYIYKGVTITRRKRNRWSVYAKDAYRNWDGTGEPRATFFSLEAVIKQIDSRLA